jgi:hypothetical protein
MTTKRRDLGTMTEVGDWQAAENCDAGAYDWLYVSCTSSGFARPASCYLLGLRYGACLVTDRARIKCVRYKVVGSLLC